MSLPYAAQFGVNDFLASGVWSGFSETEWKERPHPKVNHPVWVLSHLNGIRRGVAANLGVPTPAEPEGAQAAMGEPCRSASDYPTPEALVAEFFELGQAIQAGLSGADAGVYAKTFEPTFPDGKDRTIGEALGFLLAHEALHLGQLSVIRRLHGQPGVAEVLLAKLAQDE